MTGHTATRWLLLVGGFLAWAVLCPPEIRAQQGEATIDQVASTPATSEATENTEVQEEQLVQSLSNDGLFGASFSTPATSGFLPARGSSIYQQGASNQTSISQSGSFNYSRIVHVGDFNETDVTQTGLSNTAAIGLFGDRNKVSLTQNGFGNTYVLGFAGDNLDLTGPRSRVQAGNRNTLIEVGTNRIPMRVQQQGNRMKMLIRHETP
jgi:hypothetical protein